VLSWNGTEPAILKTASLDVNIVWWFRDPISWKLFSQIEAPITLDFKNEERKLLYARKNATIPNHWTCLWFLSLETWLGYRKTLEVYQQSDINYFKNFYFLRCIRMFHLNTKLRHKKYELDILTMTLGIRRSTSGLTTIVGVMEWIQFISWTQGYKLLQNQQNIIDRKLNLHTYTL